MNFCTRCGRKLPSSGECPYCSTRYYGLRTQPLVQAVNNASSSYTTLALACFWSLSLLCLLVFSIINVNPLLFIAIPGIATAAGLWMLFAGQGHTRRLGYTFVSVSLQIMSILSALALAVLCLLCFGAIFLGTSSSSYSEISGGLLLLSVGLLFALPIVVIFLHKIRRIVLTSRGILLRSRSSVEVPLFAILLFLLMTFMAIYAALHVTAADKFLTNVSPVISSTLPSLYALIFTLLIGMSWSGMMIPLLLISITSLATFIILIRYRYRIFLAKRQLRQSQEQEKTT